MPNPPVPLALRVLRGNPSKRPLPIHEPQPERPPICPEPPAYLDAYAADEWRAVAPELHALGLLTVVDTACLSAYCSAYSNWRTAAESLARMAANDPHTSAQLIRGKYGDPQPNPLVSIARKAASDMVRFGSEFGLGPAARARIAAGFNAPPRGGGKFDGLLG